MLKISRIVKFNKFDKTSEISEINILRKICIEVAEVGGSYGMFCEIFVLKMSSKTPVVEYSFIKFTSLQSIIVPIPFWPLLRQS